MKKQLCSFALLLLSWMSLPALAQSGRQQFILYVGTYTTGDSKGIYAYRYDAANGQMQPLGLVATTENPSFLAVDKSGTYLYAVNETQSYRGLPGGAVTSFAIDRKSGKLTQKSQVGSRGADPCYISLDRSGKYLLVANYTGGNVAVIPILPEGRLGEAVSVVSDQGPLGPDKERQESAHAHWIEATAGNRFVYVSDLGLDRVLIYRFDAATGTLTPGDAPSGGHREDSFSAKLAPGTGPRHVAFSADGRFMYVLGELDSTVTVFSNDNEKYRSIQKISALPSKFSGSNTAAEIVIHPNGKFLYSSNRGADNISEFSIDQDSGKLTPIGEISTFGKMPRHFAIDPSGKRLLVANQDSGTIVQYSIDSKTGKLTRTKNHASVPSPVCLVFAPG